MALLAESESIGQGTILNALYTLKGRCEKWFFSKHNQAKLKNLKKGVKMYARSKTILSQEDSVTGKSLKKFIKWKSPHTDMATALE